MSILSSRDDSDQPRATPPPAWNPLTADDLATWGLPPHARCWGVQTLAPVAQRHPETSYRITPPDSVPYDDVRYEKHARVFDGFQYALRGVEVAEPPSYWGWDYRDSIYLAILHLIIWHPAWPFQATATRFPDGPELNLRRLSREPSKAEWQSAQRAWRILRTFRQETRGRKSLANSPAHPWRWYAEQADVMLTKEPWRRLEYIVGALKVPGATVEARVRKLEEYRQLLHAEKIPE